MNYPSLSEIQLLVADEMQATDTLMQKEMTSEVPLANLVMQYALGNGGKRFRPLLVVLSAGLCGYDGEHAITAAAFIEFIHNATLLHDDVVDESTMRRGQKTANIAFSNAASVLVGDFLYTRAFQLMVSTQNAAVIATMADATNLIAAGEVMQLANMHDPDVDEARYYRVIELKTAVLFSAACKVSAQLANTTRVQVQALENYGKQLGMAFQMMDDVLDYTGDESIIGKSLGDDLAEGKPTMPLIRAQQVLEKKDKQRLRKIIHDGEREAIDEVIGLLEKTDALQYSRTKAIALAEAAAESLTLFSDSPYKTALIALARHAANRRA